MKRIKWIFLKVISNAKFIIKEKIWEFKCRSHILSDSQVQDWYQVLKERCLSRNFNEPLNEKKLIEDLIFDFNRKKSIAIEKQGYHLSSDWVFNIGKIQSFLEETMIYINNSEVIEDEEVRRLKAENAILIQRLNEFESEKLNETINGKGLSLKQRILLIYFLQRAGVLDFSKLNITKPKEAELIRLIDNSVSVAKITNSNHYRYWKEISNKHEDYFTDELIVPIIRILKELNINKISSFIIKDHNSYKQKYKK